MTAISSISAVQARIQQIEQQFAMRRPVTAPGTAPTAIGNVGGSGSTVPPNALGASARSELGAGEVSDPTVGSSVNASGVASALGIDDPSLLSTLETLQSPLAAGGGSFDQVYAAAVQRLRAGWSTSAVTADPSGGVAATAAVASVGTDPAELSPVAGVGAPAIVGGVSVAGAVSPSTPYAAMFEAAGARHGIPPRVLAAVGYVESRFRLDAISSAGAVGMMQFLPGTAASMGVDPYDPASAIDGAARYLRHGLDRFGSLEEAIAAYNVGPGTISRAGGVLPGSQAERYLTKVIDATRHI